MHSIAGSEALCFHLVHLVVPPDVLACTQGEPCWPQASTMAYDVLYNTLAVVTMAVGQHAVQVGKSIPVPMWSCLWAGKSIPLQ